jgi:hypothetical protein
LWHPFIFAEYHELIQRLSAYFSATKPSFGLFPDLNQLQHVLWRPLVRFIVPFPFRRPNIAPIFTARIMAFKLACGYVDGKRPIFFVFPSVMAFWTKRFFSTMPPG